jgi:hypothetical protein
MKRKIIAWFYGFTMRGGFLANLAARVLFHWYCPYPLRDDWTARACIKAGDCGCSNSVRGG